MSGPQGHRNAFTVDVEDWYQLDAFSAAVPRSHWRQLTSRAPRDLDRLLALLSRHGVYATIFFQGSIADRHPELVREAARAGHEVASRGYERRRVCEMTPAQYRDDLLCAKALLEDLSGCEVIGYRAPAFSIGMTTPWAHAVIGECGYVYSSSLRPLWPAGDLSAQAPRFPFRSSSGVTEIPASSTSWASRTWPGVGGGSFRLLPYAVSKRLLQRLNQDEQASGVFHCRTWELDAEPLHTGVGPWHARLRHGIGIRRNEKKLDALLAGFAWGRMDDVFAYAIGRSTVSAPSRSQPTHADAVPALAAA